MMLAIAGVFASVALLTVAISMVLAPGNAAGRRLREVTHLPAIAVLPEILPLSADNSGGSWAGIGKLMSKTPKEIGRLRARLYRAGIKSPAGPIVFSLAELAMPVILGLPPLLLMSGTERWVGVGLGAAIGFFGPGIIVERKIKKRQKAMDNGLPDALDLMVVCIEAGSGLDQALMRCAEELHLPYPDLAEELRTVNTEIRAGKPRMEAFRNLAQRTKVDDIQSLVNMLVQTDRFGTSVGQALRTHSETSRTKRRQRAEETAQKIGVKLVFPLVLFFFPAFYIVVLGPAVIQFMHTFM